jgi:hypothetical protein
MLFSPRQSGRVLLVACVVQVSHAASLLPITLPPTSIPIPVPSSLTGLGLGGVVIVDSAGNGQATPPTIDHGLTASRDVSVTDGVVSGAGRYSYSVDYSGIRMNMEVDGQFVGTYIPPENYHQSGGQMNVTGQVNDYLLVSQAAPGDTVRMSAAGSATGTTDVGMPFWGFSLTTVQGSSTTCNGTIPVLLNGSLSLSCVVTTPLTQDQWLPFSLEVDGSVHVEGDGSTASGARPGKGHATLDAQQPTRITSIEVLDAQGLPDSNVILYDASGFNYNAPQEGAVTPEPASWILGLAGMSLLFLVRIRNLPSGSASCVRVAPASCRNFHPGHATGLIASAGV